MNKTIALLLFTLITALSYAASDDGSEQGSRISLFIEGLGMVLIGITGFIIIRWMNKNGK